MSDLKEEDVVRPPVISKVHAFFDIMFKIGTPLGLLLVAWMGSQFATKSEVEALQDKVSDIEKVLAVMVETNRVNDRQDEDIDDHEKRIRKLEGTD